MNGRLAATAALLLLATLPARAADTLQIAPVKVSDQKAVFATVESVNVVPARARIGGSVAELKVDEGQHVERGQVIAAIGDEKLVLQLRALDAQIAALEAQLAQAQTSLNRAEDLFGRGTIPKARLDEARTASQVASGALKARIADRSVVRQQLGEGDVLAPASGVVLAVPVTTRSVILPGETVAMIAERDYVLRLRVPERHARFLKTGDPVRLDGAEQREGRVRLVYPQIEDGRVVADAEVPGLGDYFVGERVRVWVSGGERTTHVVPAAFLVTRFGIDYARIKRGDGVADVPVQRGGPLPRPDMADGVEILSGLSDGDVLVRP
ncbi:efflux RND transporter periplasmic adaptor subunit [Desertibaculum subflavum]|uniref:efflux RND transporter periplasmic adaptor subunit n=1 Tax=Desertibaculum subflavum TaxID=2268458 RepID=UPI000E66B942